MKTRVLFAMLLLAGALAVGTAFASTDCQAASASSCSWTSDFGDFTASGGATATQSGQAAFQAVSTNGESMFVSWNGMGHSLPVGAKPTGVIATVSVLGANTGTGYARLSLQQGLCAEAGPTVPLALANVAPVTLTLTPTHCLTAGVKTVVKLLIEADKVGPGVIALQAQIQNVTLTWQ